MNYLYLYLGIGAVLLATVFGVHRLKQEKEPAFVREVRDALNPKSRTFTYRMVNNVMLPVIAGVLVVAVWPVAVFLKVKEMTQKKAVSDIEGEKEFAVQPAHLLQRLTVDEIERMERVSDPFNAVPDVPFGHLNTAWSRFLQSDSAVAKDAELWSFSAEWTSDWGRKELRQGYVAVVEGLPRSHFLTVCKDLPEENVRSGSMNS